MPVLKGAQNIKPVMTTYLQRLYQNKCIRKKREWMISYTHYAAIKPILYWALKGMCTVCEMNLNSL